MTEDTRKERGLCELYAEDPERADALLFGRVAYPDRRGFLKGAGLAAMADEELAAAAADEDRLPWTDGLPEPTLRSLAPCRGQLEAVHAPPAALIGLGTRKEDGKGFDFKIN